MIEAPNKRSAQIDVFVGQPGGMLKALHALQSQSEANFLSPADIKLVASKFGVPVAKVWGTVTFYSLFATTPRGRHIIRVCENAPCHVVGASDILAALEQHLKIRAGGTTTDGLFTLEATSCLGVCGVAPAIMIDSTVYGNLTKEQLPALLAEYRQEAQA
ncbi:MAG: NAD(P)H-dependent oxidoreductase subunit E [Peptococcaceae bacterium]|nr:NAD(P)H-dependent oxidoreductase subunit E [Peptococcaceae bacterium]